MAKTTRPSYMADRLIVAERLDCASSTAFLWLRDKRETYQRRCAAALAATRTDFKQPVEGMAEWLSMNYGISATEVAEWYGYDRTSFYSWTGNGRFAAKRPHRAWTLVDYYLKEHGHVAEDA